MTIPRPQICARATFATSPKNRNCWPAITYDFEGPKSSATCYIRAHISDPHRSSIANEPATRKGTRAASLHIDPRAAHLSRQTRSAAGFCFETTPRVTVYRPASKSSGFSGAIAFAEPHSSLDCLGNAGKTEALLAVNSYPRDDKNENRHRLRVPSAHVRPQKQSLQNVDLYRSAFPDRVSVPLDQSQLTHRE